uniref:Uncharacterized protein n=1 Tax=Glossina pallidipes TaxID=7398 RepID=A0A1A9ZX89_GLOPL
MSLKGGTILGPPTGFCENDSCIAANFHVVVGGNELWRYDTAQWGIHAQRLPVFMTRGFVYDYGLAVITVVFIKSSCIAYIKYIYD